MGVAVVGKYFPVPLGRLEGNDYKYRENRRKVSRYGTCCKDYRQMKKGGEALRNIDWNRHFDPMRTPAYPHWIFHSFQHISAVIHRFGN